MRFPTFFQRQKSVGGSTLAALGSDAAPTNVPPSIAADDNLMVCRLRDTNGWPCHRVAVCFTQVLFGGYTVSGVGATIQAVTLTGTTKSVLAIEIDITATGIRGVATFSWKLGGVVQQTGQTVAATFVLGTTGLTANFPAGTYTNGDVYSSVFAATTTLNMDAFFWENTSQHWYKINDSALAVKPNQLFFFDTVTILEAPPTNQNLLGAGSPAQAGAMEVILVVSDPGTAAVGVYNIVAGPDMTPVGT